MGVLEREQDKKTLKQGKQRFVWKKGKKKKKAGGNPRRSRDEQGNGANFGGTEGVRRRWPYSKRGRKSLKADSKSCNYTGKEWESSYKYTLPTAHKRIE